MTNHETTDETRRRFLKTAATGALTTTVLSGFPTILPASVFGKNAPSNRINVGAIGTGRISRDHDMPGVWQYDNALIMAVCDLDSKRADDAKKLVNGYYAKKTGKDYDGVRVYTDYRELLINKDIDAVLVSTPDHWHAPIVVDAVRAGKDVYMQKPASLTIAEGRMMADAVKQSGRIVQVGSQQRSSQQFRYAAELIRNGRIGQLKTVYVGLPGDPSGDEEPQMPVPKKPELRYVARHHAGGLLYRKARSSAGRLQPPRLAPLRAVRRGHDYGLGVAPHRLRPTGP